MSWFGFMSDIWQHESGSVGSGLEDMGSVLNFMPIQTSIVAPGPILEFLLTLSVINLSDCSQMFSETWFALSGGVSRYYFYRLHTFACDK